MSLNKIKMLPDKKHYVKPEFCLFGVSEEDIIRTSQMGWDSGWGDWEPGRDDTYFDLSD